MTGEDRRKLRAALDELVACHRLIEAALSDDEIAGQAEAETRIDRVKTGRSAEI